MVICVVFSLRHQMHFGDCNYNIPPILITTKVTENFVTSRKTQDGNHQAKATVALRFSFTSCDSNCELSADYFLSLCLTLSVFASLSSYLCKASCPLT